MSNPRFVPQRLTIARELRGITRTALAERARKTASAISQFESGRSNPDEATLSSIALTLGLPIGFFRRPIETSALSVSECHFRSLRSASQRERKRLLAFGTLLCELAHQLESAVVLPSVSVEPQPLRDESSEAEIEQRASAVRSRWGLGQGPVIEVIRLLESKGIITALSPNSSRVDAFSGWQTNRPFVFLVQDSPFSRLRFDAAHELGHLEMHSDVSPGDKALERQANRFGAAFLVPSPPFLAQLSGKHPSLSLFLELKKTWGVSAALLIRRAFDLGQISQSRYYRLFKEISSKGIRTREPHEIPMSGPTMLQTAVDVARASGISVPACSDLGGSDFPALLAQEIA